jgi:hypothetical protein
LGIPPAFVAASNCCSGTLVSSASGVRCSATNDEIKFAPYHAGPIDPDYNPLDDLRLPENENIFSITRDSFVRSRSAANTRQIIKRIDETQRDCRTLVGALPEYNLSQRCRLASQLVTLGAGSLQFAVAAGLMTCTHPVMAALRR